MRERRERIAAKRSPRLVPLRLAELVKQYRAAKNIKDKIEWYHEQFLLLAAEATSITDRLNCLKAAFAVMLKTDAMGFGGKAVLDLEAFRKDDD